MKAATLQGALRQLLDLLPSKLRDEESCDSRLLRRFHRERDEDAFAELIRRHGGLVLGVCGRVLRDGHAAEDACQAVFLLLARKAGRLRRRGSLAGWLHAVAVRVAGQARRAEERRRQRERQCALPINATTEEPSWREVRQLLDAELARLPERYRSPLVLCYLQGLSHEEAAQRLGWSVTTLRGRLERGRQTLRRRLERLGLPVAAILVPILPATVSAALRAATLVTVRTELTGGVLPVLVAEMARQGTAWVGVAKATTLAAMGLLVAVVGFGLAGAFGPANEPEVPPAPVNSVEVAINPQEDRAAVQDDPLPPDALARMGTTRHRILRGTSLLLPDDKTLLIRASLGGNPQSGPRPPSELRWMDRESGRVIDSWTAPDDGIFCGVSPDGRLAVTVHGEAIRLWDVTTRKVLRALEGKSTHHLMVYFSRDQRMILGRRGIPLNNAALRAWETDTGKELWPESQWGSKSWRPLGFTHDDRAIVVTYRVFTPGQWKSTIKFLERDTGRELRELPTAVGSPAWNWDLSPDGRFLAGEILSAKPIFWDLTTWKELPPPDGLQKPLRELAFSPDGKTLVTKPEGPLLQVWDWPSGKLRRRIEIGDNQYLGRLAFTKDGKQVFFTREYESVFCFLDLETGRELPQATEAHTGRVECLALTTDGKVVSGGNDNTIRVWDLRMGQHLMKIATAHTIGPSTLALSADGQIVATANYQRGTVAIHELRTGRLLRTFDAAAKTIDRLAFAPSGRLLAVLGREDKPNAKGDTQPYLALWDAETGKESHRLEGGGATYDTAMFTSDGRRLVGTAGKQIRIWDVGTGKVRRELPHPARRELTLSPNGWTLAYSANEVTVLVELATGRERVRLNTGSTVNNALRFSPDSRFLVNAERYVNPNLGETSLWDVFTGDRVHTFRSHDHVVYDVQFTHDGRTMVSASGDTTLLAWDFAGVVARQRKAPRQPTAGEVAAAWKALSGDDAKAAYQGIATLVAAPERALPILREHLQPVKGIEAKRAEGWLAALGSPNFAEREAATRELERHADQIEATLVRFLADKPPLEARKRVEDVLAEFDGPVTDPARLQSLRGLEVLEFLGDAEARKLLKTLAGGAAAAELTREAAASLERLARRGLKD